MYGPRVYQLRPYQQDAVEASLRHFRREKTPAVIVLPTGAGKSLVIAELARIARGRALILAHVRELVEQNHRKYVELGLEAGIYSAGLNRKESHQKVIFGSIQSIARAPADFFANFGLLIIDECHRVSTDGDTQYEQVITALRAANPAISVLGLTATPYRLGFGWIYEYHEPRGMRRSRHDRFFKKCIYELPLRTMIDEDYLTLPVPIDSPVACYDFSSLKIQGASFVASQVEKLLRDQKRITPVIVKNIVELSADRMGVMIFAASVAHAQEVLKELPRFVAAMIVGETESRDRADAIEAFKKRQLKYLVNVSVLTTGFDAPHVDLIALLRPTESVSLYQQIVGRGLRLSPGKTDCLILDYTGQSHDLYAPEIDEPRPFDGAVLVDVPCPACRFVNRFWGIVNADGLVLEHFGRRCQGASEDPTTGEMTDCGFRFRFKVCDACGAENDISARACADCGHVLVDPDVKLKEAMALRDAHVMRVDMMYFAKNRDRQGRERLEISYADADANLLKEHYYFDSPENLKAFQISFVRMHNRRPEIPLAFTSLQEVLNNQEKFRLPAYIIARQNKKLWTVREKIF